ncbi:unnamed protein product, partial [Iphiclides podalirius]
MRRTATAQGAGKARLQPRGMPARADASVGLRTHNVTRHRREQPRTDALGANIARVQFTTPLNPTNQ